MGSSLVRRQLQDKLDVLRIRADNDAGCGQIPVLNKADQALRAGRTEDAGRVLQDVLERLDARAADREAEEAARSAERLAKRRGVPTAREPGGPSTRDGFLWLVRKGRVTQARYDAGQRYGELYAKARGDGVKSVLNDSVGSGDGDGPTGALLRAVFALDAANLHIFRAMGEAQGRRMVAVLERVCGRGETLREVAGGDDRRTLIVEAELMTALDMQSVHFGVNRG